MYPSFFLSLSLITKNSIVYHNSKRNNCSDCDILECAEAIHRSKSIQLYSIDLFMDWTSFEHVTHTMLSLPWPTLAPLLFSAPNILQERDIILKFYFNHSWRESWTTKRMEDDWQRRGKGRDNNKRLITLTNLHTLAEAWHSVTPVCVMMFAILLDLMPAAAMIPIRPFAAVTSCAITSAPSTAVALPPLQQGIARN